MSTYEELSIICQFAVLVVAILCYIGGKGTKK